MIRFGSVGSVHSNLPPKIELNIFSFKNSKLKPNQKFGNGSVDFSWFVRFVGFLHTSTFSVGVCSRFQSNLKISHLNDVKRIIKYVSGTCDYGLLYSKESNLSLAGLLDSDWASNADDRKSTTGGYFYVEANIVAWMSRKQNFVSLSTAEAEYIAARNCCS